MCDHSDRSSTPEASHATFAMSNMIPQSPFTNEKAWRNWRRIAVSWSNAGTSTFTLWPVRLVKVARERKD